MTSAYLPGCDADGHPSASREDALLGSHSSPLGMPKRRFGEPRCGESASGQALGGMRASMAKWCLCLYGKRLPAGQLAIRPPVRNTSGVAAAGIACRPQAFGWRTAMRRKRAGVGALGNACIHGKMVPRSISINVCPPCCAPDGRPSARAGMFPARRSEKRGGFRPSARGDVSGAGCQDRLRRDIRPRCARTFCWGVTVRCLLCR